MGKKKSVKKSETESKKKCFVIGPIGEEGSIERRNINGLIELIESVIDPELEVIASHKIDDSGSITTQIVNHLLHDDLVISDLTTLNANVMYELAIRHAKGKPVVIIAMNGTKLPFDIGQERTAFFSNDIKGSQELSEELKRKIPKALEQTEPDNPIYRAQKSFHMIESAPGKTDKYILEELSELKESLKRIEEQNQNINVSKQFPPITWSEIQTPSNWGGKTYKYEIKGEKEKLNKLSKILQKKFPVEMIGSAFDSKNTLSLKIHSSRKEPLIDLDRLAEELQLSVLRYS